MTNWAKALSVEPSILISRRWPVFEHYYSWGFIVSVAVVIVLSATACSFLTKTNGFLLTMCSIAFLAYNKVWVNRAMTILAVLWLCLFTLVPFDVIFRSTDRFASRFVEVRAYQGIVPAY